MRLALLAVWLAPGVVAQATPDSPWGFLAAYGAAAPFAALCLWMLTKKDREIEGLKADNARVTDAGMGQVVPALTLATKTVSDASKVMEAVVTMMHQLQARSLDAEIVGRLIRVLNRMERRLGISDDTVE